MGKVAGKLKRIFTCDENYFDKVSRSAKLVWENKVLFIMQILATVLFLSLLVFIMYKYIVQAVEHQQYVIAYLETIPVNDPLSSPLGADPLQIYEHMKGVRTALILLGVFSFLAVFFLNGLSWLITKLMISKKGTLEFLKSYSAVMLAYTIPFGMLFFYTLKFSAQRALEAEILPYLNFVTSAILLVVMYFFYISLSLATNSKLVDIPKKTIKNAANLKVTIPIFATAVILTLGLSLLVQKFAEGSFAFLAVVLVLLLISVAYCRVLFSVSFE